MLKFITKTSAEAYSIVFKGTGTSIPTPVIVQYFSDTGRNNFNAFEKSVSDAPSPVPKTIDPLKAHPITIFTTPLLTSNYIKDQNWAFIFHDPTFKTLTINYTVTGGKVTLGDITES